MKIISSPLLFLLILLPRSSENLRIRDLSFPKMILIEKICKAKSAPIITANVFKLPGNQTFWNYQKFPSALIWQVGGLIKQRKSIRMDFRRSSSFFFFFPKPEVETAIKKSFIITWECRGNFERIFIIKGRGRKNLSKEFI